jgi:hypothetical protein
VDECDLCGKDLRDKEPLKSRNERLIEDISDPVEETEVINIIQEKKYCDDCKKVITAKSDLALPGADIGLNASVIICYFWVALCLPYTQNRVRTQFSLIYLLLDSAKFSVGSWKAHS